MKMILDSKGSDPLNLELVKAHLVVEHDIDNTLIQVYIQSSLDLVEKYINKPITTERYYSPTGDFYEVPYKPTHVYLYQDGAIVEEVTEFEYVYPKLTFQTTTPHNEVIVEIEGKNSPTIQAARLLHIGSQYATRENEDFSNKKEISISIARLLDLNSGVYL